MSKFEVWVNSKKYKSSERTIGPKISNKANMEISEFFKKP